MVADAEQPALEVEADLGHQRLSERLLAFDAECVRDGQRFILAIEGVADEPRQHVAQLREQGIDLGLCKAGLVAVEQGIVGIAAQRVGEGLGLFPREREHGFERTGHGCPIVRRTRWSPHLLAGGRRRGQCDNQIAGQGARLLPVTPDQFHVDGLPVVEILGECGLSQIAGLVGPHHVVHQAGQGRQRLGPDRPAAGRHHGRLIP